MTRTGKIARLPRAIREELNLRLEEGEQGTHLLEWLNAHPDVQRILADSFEGRPITDGNLSDWKVGGFQDWKHLREACDWARTVSAEADHIASEAGLLPLSDRLAPLVSFALGKLIRQLASEPLTDSARYDKFMGLLSELSRLRRDDQNAAELRMELEDHELHLHDMLRQRSLTSIPLRPVPGESG
jgi:hypothetical protein